jgi:hypothetical protein
MAASGTVKDNGVVVQICCSFHVETVAMLRFRMLNPLRVLHKTAGHNPLVRYDKRR